MVNIKRIFLNIGMTLAVIAAVFLINDNSFFVAIFGIPAVVLIFLCRSAFKGYKTEYLDRYHKTVIFSVITGWIPIIYFIWYKFFFTPTGYFFPGLGEALMCILLFAAVPVINIIVWIISAAAYCKKQKELSSDD